MRAHASGTFVGLMLIVSAIAVHGHGSQQGGQRAGGPGTTAPAPANGIIVGRVVDAGTGQPVPDAEVTVAVRNPVPQGSNPFSAAGANTSVRLLTASDGRFVVRDLPVGNVQLSARAPGYVNGNHGQTRPAGPSSPVQITAESRLATATIRLWKFAVVTGVVTDERNDPAVNVTVRVMARTYSAGVPRLAAAGSARTDDRGVYRVAGLAPGDYVVVVPQTQTTLPVAAMDDAMQSAIGGAAVSAAAMELAAAGMTGGSQNGVGVRVGDQLVMSQSGAMPELRGGAVMAAYVTQYHPASLTAAEATVLTLASGEQRGGVDIRMPLLPTATIAGRANGPDGPLGNVQVRLLNAVEADTADLFSDVARSMTAVDGTFRMVGVPVGQYVVKILRPARQTLPPAMANNPQLAALMAGRGGGPVSPSDALTLFANVPVSVDSNVADLAITLSAGATISGRVEFSGAAAQPQMSAVNVTLTPLYWGSIPARPAAVGEDGRFTTTGAPAGRYFMTVAGRTPGWFVKSAMVAGVNAIEQSFDLSNENVGNVVVTFSDRQTTMTGSVIGSGNAPAEGTVIVFPAAHREWITRGMSPRLMRNIKTTPQGTFSMTGLPARDYLIVALSDDQVPDVQNPAAFDALARAATPVTLTEGDTRTLSLKLAQVVR